jgi:hypothetical protein
MPTDFLASSSEHLKMAPPSKEATSKIRKFKTDGNRYRLADAWVPGIIRNPFVVNSNLSRVFRSLDYAKLPPYRHSPKPLKVMCAFMSIQQDPELVTIAVSLNAHKNLEKKLNDAKELNYVRDQVRKILSTLLPGQDIFFYLVLENTGQLRPHFHGAIGVPKSIFSIDWQDQLNQALRESSLCRKYIQRGRNKAVHLKSESRINDIEFGVLIRKVDAGWGEYTLKDWNPSSICVMSKELIKKGKWYYNAVRDSHPLTN